MYGNNTKSDVEYFLDKYCDEVSSCSSRTCLNKTALINLYPHYTDKNLSKDHKTIDVFGRKEDGLKYVYSDRLLQGGYNKANRCADEVSSSGVTKNTAAWVEAYLSLYFGKQVDVRHIISGVNWSNGFPYWCAGYKEVEK